MIYLYIYLAIYVAQVYFGIVVICKDEGSFDFESDAFIFGLAFIPIMWLFYLGYYFAKHVPQIKCDGLKLYFDKDEK